MPLTHLGDFSDPFNRVFIGDNLPALRALHAARGECVDLVYLDPPFNSNAAYAFIGGVSAATTALQNAFNDTWNYAPEVFNAAAEDPHVPMAARNFLHGWKAAFGVAEAAAGRELAYLCHMTPRLAAIRAVMKPGASIYLHCDRSAAHALKKAMDAVFGAENFRNEIVWFYPDTPGRSQRDFPRKHDNIFRYVKDGGEFVFNGRAVAVPVQPASRKRYQSARKIGGREYLGGKGWKIPEDVWRIPAVKKNKGSKESMGYPTQKPLALLRRIIAASSNPGDVVLDPYCGCGTTIAACRETAEGGKGRRFIGMDMEGFAAQVMKKRMHDKHGGYELRLGYPRPTSPEEFDTLAENQAWLYYEHYAVELIPGAMPATTETKKLLGLPAGGGGDQGMDGLLPMLRRDNGGREDVAVVISVKAGKSIPAAAVRELAGVIANENNRGIVGGMLLYRRGKPTAGMRREAAGAPPLAGPDGRRYPGIRMLSVKELWDARTACKDDPQCWARRLELPLEWVQSLSADFSARGPKQAGIYSDADA